MALCFVINVVISLICLISESPIYSHFWEYSDIAIYNVNLYYTLLAVLAAHYITILFLYFIAGRYLLKNLNTPKSTFISIWYFGILCVLINFFIVLSFISNNPGIWGIAVLIYPLFMPFAFFSLSSFQMTAGLFIVSLLPSLFLWLGSVSRRKKLFHDL